MIEYITGDLLKADTEALVNTVNTVGVMGKGIALQFKEEFQQNNKEYKTACKAGRLKPGVLLSVWDNSLHLGRKLIINFPTKVHWRQPSRYEYIEEGLKTLRLLILETGIKSIAVPPLGCGNGGLEWDRVKILMEKYLGDLPAKVLGYTPNAEIKELLQKQETVKKEGLTPQRAQLLYLLFAYESLGEDSSLFAANKLAYFLQRMGQPMQLQFKPHHYGPYALGVEKVLYYMNGIYLKGLEQGKAGAFEPLKLNYGRWSEVQQFIRTKLDSAQQLRLQKLLEMVSSFLSEMSLEILASTAYLLEQNPSYNLAEIITEINSWNSRKSKFQHEHIRVAYEHLQAYQGLHSPSH
jgi:O-acetyl-ADP-ribose deacetylase (regulator of RNase III)